MGQLEYLAMPSLRNVAHDGWLCTLYIYYIVVVEYLTSSPVNDTRRHYKREYFIYKLFM